VADMSNEQLKGYEELCRSYHAIDSFRSQLLGFLPLVSGGGVFLLLNEAFTDSAKLKVAQPLFYPIGLFGFVTSLGLFFFELYGIRKCHALIEAGTRMECLLTIKGGQFEKRPRGVFYVINEPFAAGVIYPAVLGAWMFLALLFPQSQGSSSPATERALEMATRVFIVGCSFTIIYSLLLAYGRRIWVALTGKKANQPSECN
jgi:hypothetical protein